MKSTFISICAVVLFVLTSCQRSEPSQYGNQDFSVNVRIPEEPSRMNPMLANTFIELQVLNLIFLPLAEYDPYTLEYQPLLIKEIGPKRLIPEGESFAGETQYDFEIREEATWSDGRPVTADDYLFTAKAPFVPQINAGAWLSYLSNILDIRTYPDNPKKFTVIVEKEYLLALESATNFQILPKHIYDPDGLLDSYDFGDLRNADADGTSLEDDSSLIQFADRYTSDEFSRNQVVGCGPYVLDQWETGQYLAFNRIEDWWGDGIAESRNLFNAFPNRIIYQIITDEAVAITALKDGQVDVMTINDPVKFVNLRDDPNQTGFHFLTSRLPVYYYIGMNNQSKLLRDPKVRKAVAHTLDVDQIIKDLMHGTAIRTVGPINPGKSYYNRDISPTGLDLEKAASLLKEAGWEDSNQNGIVDREIDGELSELILRFFVTQRELGRKTALMHKESASKIGIQIDLVTKPDFNVISREHLATGDYELVASGSRISPADYDPYQNWHSDNYQVGSNFLGFANDRADKIIEKIRTEEDVDKRATLYKEFQQIVHDEQAAVFLFSPASLIVVNRKFDAQAAERRPGYFEAHFRLAE